MCDLPGRHHRLGMRSHGTAAEREARRRLAVPRVREGWTRRGVAAFLGVRPGTVAEWGRAHDAGGGGPPGRRVAPGADAVPDRRPGGAGSRVVGRAVHRFRTDRWTARRAKQRGQEVADRWRRGDGPAAKNRCRGARPPRPDRRAGRGLGPLARRPRALEGNAPVAGGGGGHRKPVSVIGAARVSPAAGRPGPYVSTPPGGYFTAGSVADVLRGLLRHLRGKVVVVWGGAGATRVRRSGTSSGGARG